MNRLGGDVHGGPFRLNVAKVKVPLSAVLAAWLGSKAGAGLLWLGRHPLVVAPVLAVWLLARVTDALGGVPLLLVLVLTVAGLVVWRVRWRESFTRQVTWRLRGLWRGRFVYRFAWQPAMVTTGLAVTLGAREYLPKIRSIRSTGSVDRVRVRMLPGQTMEDWADAAPRLAQTFAAQECRVRTLDGKRQELVLWFLVHDPLTQPVEPFPAAHQSVDFTGLPVARREDGLTYRLRLLGTHLLVVGATGSGKGPVIWSLITALAPSIREGSCQVWALDPKGGMELAGGRGLFSRFVYGDPDDAADDGPGNGSGYEVEFARVLEDAVTVMRRRQATLRGVTRLHSPTPEEPLVVVVVDELASLTAYVTDRDAKRRIAAALSLLLSQGRAVGVTVVGAVQDPRKDIVAMRDLFPTRIALRLSEAEQVALVLGSGARDRGARCDAIPESLPGVGYVGIDGVAEPVRVRFSHITDAHIDALAADHDPTSKVTGERPVQRSGEVAA
ncbi:MAG TPA: FtsK/SpoIIIE domain-containing protein [Nocardioidaceae bacterium]|nr:FtsK/SpoIIIE domain-containing protein [Nocardioidaceae bacterium]